MSHHSQGRKADILGMPFGTACNKLRRIVMFHLLLKHSENICFVCGEVIRSPEELTIEHKAAWLASGPELFWDVNNIAFAHQGCNLRAGWVRRQVADGTLWCSSCKSLLPVSSFHKDRHQRTGFALLCRGCFNARRRKVEARGDCRHCGARRGTKPFRVSHNACLECYNAKVRERRKARLNKEVENR